MEENNDTHLQTKSYIVPVNVEHMDPHISIPTLEASEDGNSYESEPKCCIYKVPEILRGLNKEAYTPQMVSIGPIHRKNPQLRKMEEAKKKYEKRFIERNKDLAEEFRKYINCNEARIRACYDDDYFESDSLESIIMTDVIFVFQVFIKEVNLTADDDSLLDTPIFKRMVGRDLQLLENQIPLFLFNELVLKSGVSDDPIFFLLLATNFLCGWGCTSIEGLLGDSNLRSIIVRIVNSTSFQNIKHFTDLRRCLLLVSFPPPQGPLQRDDKYEILRYRIPCATKFQASGVEFSNSNDFDGIKIRHEAFPLKVLPLTEHLVLQIPGLGVWKETEYLIRNVMALEQLHYPWNTHICSYIVLMDFLIDTDKDVDLLVQKGILPHLLGDSAAIASLFNELPTQIVVKSWCYSGIAKELKKHYNKRWNHTKTTLKSVYFKDLWTGTATFAATALLLLTLIQTVYSIH